MIVPDGSVIEVINRSDDHATYLTIDGQIGELLKRGDTVVCRRSEHSISLVRPPDMMFFDVLRRKIEMGRTMKRIKSPSLTAWILIALVAGIAFGAIAPEQAQEMGLLGTIFLRMIKAIIAPLLFGTLVYGIAGTGSLKTMGRIGGKAILYFEGSSPPSLCSSAWPR